MTEYCGPTTITILPAHDMNSRNITYRLNPEYFEDRYTDVERELKRLGAEPLDRFIPETLPDGSKGITYGQVGARVLSPRGSVRYLQVINIRDTGIDFAIKPDRVAENSHNDPPRSRIHDGDILFTNTAFRGTQTLMGRCIVVHRDLGKVNISQDIDRIRVAGINPYFVCVFLKTSFGKMQIDRIVHGVDSTKINFGHIRALLIPDRAMELKEQILVEKDVAPGRFGETINALAEKDSEYKEARDEARSRHQHLVEQVERILKGSKRPFKDFRVPRIRVP